MNTIQKWVTVSALLTGVILLAVSCGSTQSDTPTAYDFQVSDIHGGIMDLSEFKGQKVSLFVNTATECGLTPQFTKLQKLYDTYKDNGFEIVGFPSNSFNQESKTDEEIVTFCTTNFLVDFPMTTKINVKGPDQHELYAYLTSSEADPAGTGDITWNFEKFLIDRNGNIIGRFQPEIEPDDQLLIDAIEHALAQPAE